jgi:nicotinamide mononucleotide adenylyltransferase
MKIGVITGRFQSQRLTDGHKSLFNRVFFENDKIIVFVGVYPKSPDFKNPLPFEMRYQMIGEYITSLMGFGCSSKSFEIIPIVDVFDLPRWNKILDEKIEQLTSKDDEILLYGSRDSFVLKYFGKYKIKEIIPDGNYSATELRNQILKIDTTNVDEKFRAGVIWGVMYANGHTFEA